MKRITLPVATKDVRAEADPTRSDAWRVVDALSDGVTWHVIHLEYVQSGRTGKFYRIYLPDLPNPTGITHWGARPTFDTGCAYAYGDRGQYKPVPASRAYDLLDQKICKGYRVVAESAFRGEKTLSGSMLSKEFDRLCRSGEVNLVRSPQWRGWRYV
jgi:hypothetical protein